MPLLFLGNGAFSRVRVVSLKEISGGVEGTRAISLSLTQKKPSPKSKSRVFSSESMRDEMGFSLNSFVSVSTY